MEAVVPSTDALLTFGGLSLFTTAVVEVILRAWKPSPETQDRFGPVVAYIVAIVSAVLMALWLAKDLPTAVILGVMVGWASMGVHDTTKTVVG